ncbi:MAG TPA: hypothetical protein VF825_18435, partial [Oryzihumus sp.]
MPISLADLGLLTFQTRAPGSRTRITAGTTEGRSYFDAKKAAGKTSMEAMRALKRRLSNVVYARMAEDQKRREATGPGGHSGTTLQSSVTDLTPDIGSSDKPLPGPANSQPKPALP